MLQISENIKYPDIALEPEEIEVSVFNNTLVFPPLNKLVFGKPLNDSFKVSPKDNTVSDHATNQMIEGEIQSLLKLKNRFADSSTYLSRLSTLYRLAGKKELSIEYAEIANKLNSSVFYKQRLAEAYLNGNRQKEALKIFSDLYTQGYVDAHLRLAEAAIDSRNMEEAGNIVENALKLDELDWRSRLVAGGLALAKNEFQQAIRHYRIAAEERPNSSTVRLNIAISQYMLGNFRKSLKDAQRAISLYPLNKKALYFLADITLQESNKSKTDKSKNKKSDMDSINKLEKYLEAYFSLMPKDNGLLGRLADVYLFQNKIKEGIQLLEDNKQEINDPAIWNNLGVFWSSRKKEVAAKYYKKALEIVGGVEDATKNRGASFAVLNIANLLIGNQNYSQAQKILEVFIGASDTKDYLEDKDLCKIPISLIAAYINQDMLESCLELSERLLKESRLNILGQLDVLTILTSYHSLVTFDHKQNLEFAERALSLAHSQINVVPKSVYMMVINNLVCAYIDIGRIDEAKNWVDHLRLDYGNEEYIYATKGLYSLSIGNFEQAKVFYEKSISVAENKERKNAIRVKMNYELGKFSFDRKEWTRAKLYLKKVMQAQDVRDGWSIRSLQALTSKLLVSLQKNSLLQ